MLLSTQMIPVMISPPQNEPIENVASEHANDSYNNYNDIPSPAHELCKLISLSKTNLSKTSLSKTNLSKTKTKGG